MIQLFFHNATALAAYGILLVGILGVFYILSWLSWKLADYLFRSTKSVVIVIEYARHRKEFKKWRKERPNINVYTPKLKE